LYQCILKLIRDKLPNIIMFTYDRMDKEENNVSNEREEEDNVPRPRVGLHYKGRILNPISMSKHIKKFQVNKHRSDWIQKRVQGLVGAISKERTIHTTYFINSNSLTPEEKNTFMKISTGTCVTKSDKKRWGLITNATCSLSGTEDETIRHILTVCKSLKHLYIERHNAIVRVIERFLVPIENINVAYCEVEWDTIEECYHNRPDIVISTPSDMRHIPEPFHKTLTPSCHSVVEMHDVFYAVDVY
jgi:hypothetical protein